MYGVIVCSECRKARGVSLSSKSTQCTHCGAKLDVRTAKIMFKSEDQAAIREAMGIINAAVVGREDEFEAAISKLQEKAAPKDGILEYADEEARIVEAAMKVPDWPDRYLIVARELSRKGSFTREEYQEMVERMKGPFDADEVLDQMLGSGMIFSPKEGHYQVA